MVPAGSGGAFSGIVRSVLYEGETVELVVSLVGISGVREVTMKVHALRSSRPRQRSAFPLGGAVRPRHLLRQRIPYSGRHAVTA